MSKKSDAKTLVTKTYKKRGQFAEIFHRLKKNKGAMIGLAMIILIILIFLFSLFFISYTSITKGVIRDRLTHPNGQYPFGTDSMGRNMLMRVLYGSRYSLALGFGGSVIATFFGISLGAVSGYFGGLSETLIMRFADIMSSIPAMLLGMVIMSALGTNLINLIVAVGVTSIPIYIRITRASILAARNEEYVDAARALGFPNFRIIFRHVLPNGLSAIIVTFTMNFGLIILAASGLSFLGFGIQVPLPEWGTLVAGAREHSREAAYLLTIPGVAIMLTVLAFNMLGDGMRDALDPKLKR